MKGPKGRDMVTLKAEDMEGCSLDNKDFQLSKEILRKYFIIIGFRYSK